MDRKERILGSVYGAMVGEALGLQVETAGLDVLESTGDLVLWNTAWLKHHLYLATNILKVFASKVQRVQEVPSEAYLNYVFWMASQRDKMAATEPRAIQEAWAVEDFKYLNQYLGNQAFEALVAKGQRLFVPVLIEYESLGSQEAFGKALLKITTHNEESHVQAFHDDLMFHLGRSHDFQSLMWTQSQVNHGIKIVEGYLQKPLTRGSEDSRADHEYLSILKVLEKGQSFEADLKSVLRQTANPIDCGMVAGNLLGKFYGLSAIPNKYLEALER